MTAPQQTLTDSRENRLLVRNHRQRRRRLRVAPYFGHAGLIAYSVITLVPLLFVVYLSGKTLGDIGGSPLSIPNPIQWSNFPNAWVQGNLGQYLMNSVVAAAVTVLIILVFGSLAAYVIARYRFRGNQLLYLYFVSGLALPVQIIALPLFILMRQLGLLNTLLSLIVALSAGGMSFSVFILVNFMRGIPNELQEAAVMDGAGPIRIYWHIVLPLIRPAIAIVAIFQFLGAWKEFFLPLVLIQSPNNMTLPVGIMSFVGEYAAQWNLLFAAVVLVSLPTIIGFFLVGRQFRRGVMGGAMKG